MKASRFFLLLIVTILLLPISLSGNTNGENNPFKIQEINDSEIRIQFTLPQWEIEQINVKNEIRKKVKVQETPYLFIDEEETLPVFSTMIAIPNRGGVDLLVSNSSKSSINEFTADFDAALNRESQQGRFTDIHYPAANVVISEPQILRDFRVVNLNIYPFQYDRINRKLLVSENLDIKLTFNSRPSINELNSSSYISCSFDSIYRGLILNYESLRQTREIDYRNPVMLVIYGNYTDTNYLSKINEFVTWKKQRGFIVNAVSTGVTGTTNTNIKSYIQTAYNNPATRPDYIVLIGDTDGTIAVPSNNTYVDYQYTWLAGSDNLGDVMIGRISVTSTADLDVILAKIISLEKNIGQHPTDWLNRMVLVGDTGSSGISTIYTNRYIRDISEEINPGYTYTEVYGSSPSNTTINNAINQGVMCYNFRGYINMNSWPSTMSSLYNSYKLFHAVFITCSTGSFGGSTSTTEQVIRYGTAAALGGAITAIGMATSSTHTPMNNCLDVGIFHGIYNLGMREMSSAMLYAKLYLHSVYGVSHPTQAQDFAAYCNLMGDPTAMVYVGTPNSFIVTAPSTIPSGSANIRIGATNNNGESVEGAYVTLTTTSGLQLTGITDASGFVIINLPSDLSQNLVLTVAKDDYIAYTSSITLNTGGGIVYDSFVLDDDTTTGNGDGTLNAGEEVNLYVTLKNTSSSTLFINGRVSTTDSYVTLIEYDRLEFGDIVAGGLGENITPIVFSVSPACPDQHIITLVLTAEGAGNNWTINIPLTVRGGNLEIQSYTFVGITGNIITPGLSSPFTFSLKNTGISTLHNVYGNLQSLSNYFVVQDAEGYFGNIAPNSTVTNSSNSFTVFARGSSINGMVIPLILILSNANGYTQTLHLSITIGTTTVHDPLGQDAYGYFIYDQTDTAYPLCPSYQWIPIAPAEGGSGTLLSLTDPGNTSDEGDDTSAIAIQTVNLPFTFTFYGRQYTQASICSNGFIAFGATQNADWRNWRLPGAGGPNPMIAVFWDDLQLGTGSGVYTYYNSAQHYYVVEWYNIISGYNSSSPETFQAILYDPVYYPTITNDGQIKLQYKVFNNIDQGSGDTYPHGNYCTIGIKDHYGTDGLEYTFNNTYPTAASPLSNEKALFISTPEIISGMPHLTIAQKTVIDPNNNNHLEPGETAQLQILLRNNGLSTAENVIGVLSCSDSYVTINNATANYGNIAGEAQGLPQNNFSLSVSPSCPGGHRINFTLALSGSGLNWNYSFSLDVYVPILEFGNYTVLDSNGDNDGILDPGETANLSVQLLNTGEVASPAGTVTITTSTEGINIITGTAQFAPISGNGNTTLVFNLSADTSVAVGTLANLFCSAVAGTYSASTNIILEIGAPLEITIGTGTGTQSYPLDRYYNYSAHEAIYLASEIGFAGAIKSLAYYKAQGEDINPIESVSIYMKQTPNTTLSSGNYSLDGYTLVYNGSFTNNTTSGWMEVTLNQMFLYNGIDNLSILCLKGFQQWISNYPYWTYTSTSTTRVRQNRDDNAAPTNLTASNNLPNIRLKIFVDSSMILPPTALSATPGNGIVTLTWQSPMAGNIESYNIYRNNALYDNVANRYTYYDVDVVNGTTYSYYLTSVSGTNESLPSLTVQATPSSSSVSETIIGTGTSITGTSTASPVNIYYKSLHGQSVYTAAELNAAGIYGPVDILQLGFYIASSPVYALPNFLIRMKHTTATDVSSWQTATDMLTVYTNASYMPVAGGWDMLTLTSPFHWNGIDNIVIDTAFGLVSQWNYSGTVQYTTVTNGYRYTWSDGSDQTNVFTGGSTSSNRPNIKIRVHSEPQNAIISLNPSQLNFGAVEIGNSATLPFTIQNTGNQLLAGYFTVPNGYSLAFRGRKAYTGNKEVKYEERNNLQFGIEAGNSLTINVTFTPTAQTSYNGNLVITSNATNCHNFNLVLTGSGYYPSLETPIVTISQEDNNIVLRWNAVPNALSYQIYRSDNPYSNFTLIGTTSYLQFTDPSGNQGFYYIKASTQHP